MKGLWTALFLCGLAVLWAQSKVDFTSQVSFPNSAGYELAGWKGGALKRIQVGSGLVITENGSTIVISVAQGNPPVWNTEKPSISGLQLQLSYAPIAGSLIVTRNGLVLSQEVDYTLAGQVITLSTANTPLSGDVFRAQYAR